MTGKFRKLTFCYGRLGLVERVMLAVMLVIAMCSSAHADTTLWRIGINDGSSAEFTAVTNHPMPAAYTIPSTWATQTTWPEWPSLVGETPALTTITYNLDSVPPNGVMLTFKAVDAVMFVPELAVYSNYYPCGIIQIGGAGKPPFGPASTYARRFTRAYQLYIPAEFLVIGQNKLQINRLGHPYNRTTAIYLGFTLDYMQLDALAAPAPEPLHGKLSYLGISDGQFDVNVNTIAKAQAEAEWLGIAYSQNPERVGYFNDLAGRQTDANKLAYLQKLKDLNMTVILNGWNCGHTTDAMIVGGLLPTAAQTYTSNLLTNYGALARFYEICNEPCMGITQASQQYCLAMARYVNSHRPSTMILAAPGYAYGGGYGDPVNWDNAANDANRKSLDSLCGAYNGHNWSYGIAWENYSLAENIDAHGTFVGGNPQINNGWDKPMITTECGSATVHQDFSNAAAPNHSYSSALDRNLRANLATGDYSCAADVWNNGVLYDYLNGTPETPSTWTAADANTGAGDVDSRVKTLRRLALAYATHGAPLHYTWTNVGMTMPLAYFRAVDTSTLAPIPGSGATSTKILVSFVNFDLLNSNTISVHVRMPVSGTYTGVRYSAANSYTAAQSAITGLAATPFLDLTETLGPGESIEYILDRPAAPNNNYLSRTGWVASALVSNAAPSYAIDASLTTRWSTGVASAPGQWFQVAMPQISTLYSLNLNYANSPGDYPATYLVNVSNDGVNWGNPVASGVGQLNGMTVNFPFGVQGQYIRMTNTGSRGNFWSIHDFNVSGN